MKSAALSILACVLISACAPTVRTPDFTLSWKYYPCDGNARFMSDPGERTMPMYDVDTSSETLTYIALGQTQAITIPWHLTDAEADAIYSKAVQIGFFEYPSMFTVPALYVRGLHTPAAAYELSLTNDGWANSVVWSDHPIVEPAFAPADRLRELMDLIEKIVESHPEVQQLPPPASQCA